jgi:hypothetical protein
MSVKIVLLSMSRKIKRIEVQNLDGNTQIGEFSSRLPYQNRDIHKYF